MVSFFVDINQNNIIINRLHDIKVCGKLIDLADPKMGIRSTLFKNTNSYTGYSPPCDRFYPEVNHSLFHFPIYSFKQLT